MPRLLGLLLLLMSFSSQAALVTVNGTDLNFTYDDSTLFGTANVVGNNIFFTPTSFRADSNNLDGLVTVDETLEIMVEATTAGFHMTDFLLAEQGDYFMSGSTTSVSGTGSFSVASDTTAFSDSNLLSAGPLTVKDAVTEWSLNSVIALSDTAGWGMDTAVTLTLFNESNAFSNALGDQAWIEKKSGLFGIQVESIIMPSAIPVPAAVWLFGSALGLLGWIRRKAA